MPGSVETLLNLKLGKPAMGTACSSSGSTVPGHRYGKLCYIEWAGQIN